MPPSSPRTLINVCGMPRSGTTMLGLMLASGDAAVSCGEAAAWFRVARHRSDATVPKAFVPLKDVGERTFHRRLTAHHDVSFAVDSSKDLDWVVDHTRWAAESGLRVYNVLIYKAPADIALSWWKRNEYDRWYRYYLRYHLQMIYSGVDFWTVSYDDLVTAPRTTLQRICRLTGLPYFEGKEHFWNYDHDLLGTNSRGVREQLGTGRSEIKKPPVPDAFASLARTVEETSAQDRLLQHLRRALDARNVLTADTDAKPAPPHRYAPALLSRLAYLAYRSLKLPWGRFRWNVIEPRRAAAPRRGEPNLPGDTDEEARDTSRIAS